MLIMTACSSIPFYSPEPRRQLDFLTQVASADGKAREAIWVEINAAPWTPDLELKMALMQGVPGHSGHDLKAAQSRLQAILRRGVSADVSSLVRARLAEMRIAAECQAEARRLQQRLDEVVNIERDLKKRGH